MGLFSRGARHVPLWNTYYPSIDDASDDQKRFFNWFIRELDQGRHPDLQGNLSYLFALAYQVIGCFITRPDYPGLSEWFDRIRVGYGATTKVNAYLDAWQADAALLVEDWGSAWEWQRPVRLSVDYIVNVQRRCRERRLTATDLRALLGGKNGLTEQGNKHLGELDGYADAILEQQHAAVGMNVVDACVEKYWSLAPGDEDLQSISDECDYLVSARALKGMYTKQPAPVQTDRYLFNGALMPMRETTDRHESVSFTMRIRQMNPSVTFVRAAPAVEAIALARCRMVLREAENVLRRAHGLPDIGQGWVAETELYELLRRNLPAVAVVQHARPDWLRPQHLDVYMPGHNLGVEYQGSQHLQPVDYFGGEKAFEQQLRRDEKKRRLCAKHGCALIEVHEGYDEETVLATVRNALKGSSNA